MIYPYRSQRRGSEDRHLPLVPIIVQGSNDLVTVRALIDSGAEHNVFSPDIAERVGIDVEEHREVTISGVGGSVQGWQVPVTLKLGEWQWESETIFSSGVEAGSGLLGQLGFFAFFDVTFKYTDRVMDVRRVK